MTTPFAAFDKLKQTLASAGMDEESTSFILDKLRHSVTDRVAAELVSVAGEEAVNQLGGADSEAKLKELEAKFKEKKGKSISEFREELANQMVADFDATA